jgi:hypothetical protein
MCTCVLDEIAKRGWDLAYVRANTVELNTLMAELANQQCRVAFQNAAPPEPSSSQAEPGAAR